MQGRQDKTWFNQLAMGHDGGGKGDLGHEWMVGLSWRWGHPEKGYFRRKIQFSLGVSKRDLRAMDEWLSLGNLGYLGLEARCLVVCPG